LKGFSDLVNMKKVSLPVISRLWRHNNLQTPERYLQAIDLRFQDTLRLLEGDLLEAHSAAIRASGRSRPAVKQTWG
jgi:hypothetical protein